VHWRPSPAFGDFVGISPADRRTMPLVLQTSGGMLAAECRHGSGMHVQEDPFILEMADPETGALLPDREKGTEVSGRDAGA